MASDNKQLGLLRLMLQLPAVRGQLQLLSASNASVAGLCVAYGEASEMLERQRRLGGRDKDLVAEFESICRGIEEDVLAICLKKAGRR